MNDFDWMTDNFLIWTWNFHLVSFDTILVGGSGGGGFFWGGDL